LEEYESGDAGCADTDSVLQQWCLVSAVMKMWVISQTVSIWLSIFLPKANKD
jgi:hypothetical protein